MRNTMLLIVALAAAFSAGGCITWTDKDTGTCRTFVVPTLSFITESKSDGEQSRSVVFLPLAVSKKTRTSADGTVVHRFSIAPLATSFERRINPDGGRSHLSVSIPFLTVSKGWESADKQSYYKKTQCAVVLYGSSRNRDGGVEGRSWYFTPLFLYRRVNARKEFRLFFIPIVLSRGDEIPVSD